MLCMAKAMKGNRRLGAAMAGDGAVSGQRLPKRKTEFQYVIEALKEQWGSMVAMMPQALSRFRFPARMQRISREGREYLLDSAHNPSGMRRFVAMLEPLIEGTDWGLLFGSSPQLEMQAFLEPLIGLLARQPAVDVVCTEPQGGRYPAVPASSFPFGRPIPEPAEAIIQLRGSLLVSCGSLYLQGNLLSILGLDSDQALSLL